MEKMTESELLNWVIGNHDDDVTLMEDWDACRDAFAEGGELEEGSENWENPFVPVDAKFSIFLDGKWRVLAILKNQDMYGENDVRNLGKIFNRLGVDWDWSRIEEGEE